MKCKPWKGAVVGAVVVLCAFAGVIGMLEAIFWIDEAVGPLGVMGAFVGFLMAFGGFVGWKSCRD